MARRGLQHARCRNGRRRLLDHRDIMTELRGGMLRDAAKVIEIELLDHDASCRPAMLFSTKTRTVRLQPWTGSPHYAKPMLTKCHAAMPRLASLGHELRRPEADYLREGVYELRERRGSVNYLLLYFFHGRTFSVVSYGLTKEAAVPAADINRAVSKSRIHRQSRSLHIQRRNRRCLRKRPSTH
jgi:hypothetical protein